jgi:hypothetical protein
MLKLPSEMVKACAAVISMHDTLKTKCLNVTSDQIRWCDDVAIKVLEAAQVPELLDALRFYADRSNWVPLPNSALDHDGGDHARAALEKAGVTP